MEHFIDTLGFRSLDKVYRAVNESFPDVKKREVKNYLDSLGAGYKNAKDMKRKMGKSHSGYRGGLLYIYWRPQGAI